MRTTNWPRLRHFAEAQHKHACVKKTVCLGLFAEPSAILGRSAKEVSGDGVAVLYSATDEPLHPSIDAAAVGFSVGTDGTTAVLQETWHI